MNQESLSTLGMYCVVCFGNPEYHYILGDGLFDD